jgi:hypothetical protein
MEPIISFSFTELICRYALVKRGPRKYGTLQDILTSGAGVSCAVGMPSGDEIFAQELRNCQKYETVIEISQNILPDNEFRRWVQQKLHNLIGSDIDWESSSRYTILEYGPGGFFSEHRDRRIQRNHCGTLLIFPPAVGEFAHTGGDLVFNQGSYTFESSKNREWTFLAFEPSILHECETVRTGKRIVFKQELYASERLRTVYDYNLYGDCIMDVGIRHFVQDN